MRQITQVLGRGGTRAAVAALVAAGAIASVGVAGAAQDETIVAQGDASAGQWSRSQVTIAAGDTVTWSFEGAGHNVASNNASDTDPRWEPFVRPGPGQFDAANVGQSFSYTFYKSGSYEFICVLHPNMLGTVEVTGPDLEIPPDSTPTPPPTTTPTPTPPGGGTPPSGSPPTTTPGPSAQADSVKPRVSSVKLTAMRRAARVRFTLSESASVTIRVKRGRTSLKTVRVQAQAGTRTVNVRSSKLRKGRYTVQIQARDSYGNTSSWATKRLTLKR